MLQDNIKHYGFKRSVLLTFTSRRSLRLLPIEFCKRILIMLMRGIFDFASSLRLKLWMEYQNVYIWSNLACLSALKLWLPGVWLSTCMIASNLSWAVFRSFWWRKWAWNGCLSVSCAFCLQWDLDNHLQRVGVHQTDLWLNQVSFFFIRPRGEKFISRTNPRT